MGELSLLLADGGADAEMLRLFQLHAAVLILSSDQDWVEETLSRLDDAPRT